MAHKAFMSWTMLDRYLAGQKISFSMAKVRARSVSSLVAPHPDWTSTGTPSKGE